MSRKPETHDTHIHSNLSVDSRAAMEDMCAGALAHGAASVTFAEHIDWNPHDMGFGFFDRPRYFETFERCSRLFSGRLTLHRGIEVSEPHLYPEEVAEELQHPYDLVIGSMHMLGDRFIGDRTLLNHYSLEAMLEAYYRETAVMVRRGGFDVLAHLDLPTRYWGVHVISPQILDEIFDGMTANGIVLEVNSSNFIRDQERYMPEQDLVRRYFERGGRHVSLGSDAHFPEAVNIRLPEAAQWVRALGGTPCYFRKRQIVEY